MIPRLLAIGDQRSIRRWAWMFSLSVTLSRSSARPFPSRRHILPARELSTIAFLRVRSRNKQAPVVLLRRRDRKQRFVVVPGVSDEWRRPSAIFLKRSPIITGSRSHDVRRAVWPTSSAKQPSSMKSRHSVQTLLRSDTRAQTVSSTWKVKPGSPGPMAFGSATRQSHRSTAQRSIQ